MPIFSAQNRKESCVQCEDRFIPVDEEAQRTEALSKLPELFKKITAAKRRAAAALVQLKMFIYNEIVPKANMLTHHFFLTFF